MARRGGHGTLGAAGRLSSVGLELGIAVVVCTLGGWWLDQRLGLEPWLTLLGATFGLVVGFRSLYRAVKMHESEMDKRP